MDDQGNPAPTVQNEEPSKAEEKRQKRRKYFKVLNRKRTALYRFFDERGTLLYVGISASAFKRMASHNRRARWFGKARSVTIEWFRNREEALWAEAKAIFYEYPRYNLTHMHFTTEENQKRMALAREGKWVKPPKPPREAKPSPDKSTLAQRLAYERREELRRRKAERLATGTPHYE